MINREQAARLCNTIEIAAHQGHQALLAYGAEAQVFMAIEEMSELTLALARDNRGRETPEHIVEEAADVIITALQVGLLYGSGDDYNPDSLIDAIARKTRRLQERVDACRAIGAEQKP